MDSLHNSRRITLLGLLALLALPVAQAAPEVDAVVFNYNPAKAKETRFQVQYSNGSFQSLTPSVWMKLGDGQVKCEKHTEYGGAKLYLGSPWYVNNSLATNGAYVVDVGNAVAHTVWSGNQPITEGVPADSLKFNIVLAQVSKQVFDPVQVLKDELAKAKSQGMSEDDFLRQDRLFEVKRKVTLAGRCYGKNTPAGMGWEISEKNVSFMLQFKGNPLHSSLDLDKPPKVVPVPVVPLGGNGQIAQGKIELQVTDGQLLTNALHYQGNCPVSLDFSVRYKGLGKGWVSFHVVENNQTVYESPPASYEAADGWALKHFKVNLEASPDNLGQAVQRKFRLYFKVKDVEGAGYDWSKPGNYQGLNWSYQCKAQVVVPVGQGGLQYAPQQPAPGLQIKSPLVPSPPQAPSDIRAQPVPPSSGTPTSIQAVPSAPNQPARKID